MASKITTVSQGGTSASTTEYYNSLGYLTQVTNALGQSTVYSNHNGYGQPRRVVDINGIATDVTYDARGQVTGSTITLPNGTRTTNLSYNGWGQPTSVQRSGHGALGFAYNSAGRLINSTFAGDTVTYGYDVSTRSSTTTSPRHAPAFSGATPYSTIAGNFGSTRLADSLGRLREVVGNNLQKIVYGYDANGNLQTVTDLSVTGRVTTYDYDRLNRVYLVTLPDSTTVRTEYDTDGNVWKVTDARNLVTTYTYNGFGDLASVASPDSGSTSYGYDAGGRRNSESRANGTSITYGYDLLNRLTSRVSAGVTESFAYDEGTGGKGRLTRITDATGVTTFAYTAAGELRQQVNTISGSSYTTSWYYDTAGRRTAMNYPSGLWLGYWYDDYGRLSSITSSVGSVWATLAESFLYQPASSNGYAWRFGNSVGRAYTQDADGRVTALTSPGVQGLVLSYNTTDTIYSITDNVWGLNSAFEYD
jgi:YD repeat-containing protein